MDRAGARRRGDCLRARRGGRGAPAVGIAPRDRVGGGRIVGARRELRGGARRVRPRDARRVLARAAARFRGTCHEKLGHPYPAIDDYRAYLTARPSAADAEAIRARLEALEEQVGISKPGAARSAASDLGVVDVEASVGGKPSNLERVEHDEELDAQADASPLRRGRGAALGLVVQPLGFGSNTEGFGVLAGLDLRFAFNGVSSLIVGFDYLHVDSTGTDSALGGAGVHGGYEARIALNPRVSDALLIGATLGFDRLSQSASGTTFSLLMPLARFGYRHVFGAAFGIEAALDGGGAIAFVSGGSSSTTAAIGGHVALLVGF